MIGSSSQQLMVMTLTVYYRVRCDMLRYIVTLTIDLLTLNGSLKFSVMRLGKNKEEAPAGPNVTKFGLGADFQDLINSAKFHSNPFRGFDFIGGRILAFPIGMRCRR